jgi:hypothetical protein
MPALKKVVLAVAATAALMLTLFAPLTAGRAHATGVIQQRDSGVIVSGPRR